MRIKLLIFVCIVSPWLNAQSFSSKSSEVVQLILRETQNKEVQVAVYRRFSLADARSNGKYIEWRSGPDNVLNLDINPRPEQFVLIEKLTNGAPEFVTIYPHVDVGDLSGSPTITFSGAESTAYILIIKKDMRYPKGGLYTLVGGVECVIAKKDASSPDPALPPRFNYLFEDQAFELLVLSIREAIANSLP